MNIDAALARHGLKISGSLNSEPENLEVGRTRTDFPFNGSAKAYPLSQGMVEFKAGLFHARGRIGRAVQAAGSYVLPGNLSGITHPIRSNAASAVVPGSVGSRGRIGGAKLVRCPAGYEHGGRFSPSDLSGCGRQLFSNPTGVRGGSARRLAGAGGSGGSRASRRSGVDFNFNKPGDADASRIRGSRGGRAVQVARQADIKPVGASSAKKRNSGIDRALDSLTPKSKTAYLVRRDGSILNSVREISELHNVRTNNDMDGGAIVTTAGSVKNLGKKEIPLLLNSDINALGWKLPNGDGLIVSKSKELSADEKRRLGRAWKSGMSIPDLEAASNGAIATRVKTKDKLSQARVWIEPISGEGAPRSVPRWVFDKFMAEGAEGRVGRAWRIRGDD